MKIAVVYNRELGGVINLFGVPNREIIGQKTIKRIVDALKAGRHQVTALEGDKDLIERLEEFMPRVVKGERPGMVFNLSYGIQGQARYTHIPSILEMVGIPYVGSDPLAHSLALDKVVTKMILRQHGLPTPDFVVVDGPDFPLPDLAFPLIVKPKNEAVSFGLKVTHDEKELREAVQVILDTYGQAVLVESYIEGREVNVGLLGNNPPETFAPAEILFGAGGPKIYTYEDKTRQSGREIQVACPAEISPELTAHAQDLSRKAFQAIGAADCARVDMRLDAESNLYILEINSLPSMGEHGSYVEGARQAGLDFGGLVNRLVEVAAQRYFGTPVLPVVEGRRKSDPGTTLFNYLTSQRDRMERRHREWCQLSSRTQDPVGTRNAEAEMVNRLEELGLRRVPALSDSRFTLAYESDAGLDDGTLLLANVDVPLTPEAPGSAYRRSRDSLYGEGAGSSRGGLVSLEFCLRALRHVKRLRKTPLGVLLFFDEGLECRYSADLIRRAAARARQVLVLRPGNPEDFIIVQRRGYRQYRLTASAEPRRVGKVNRKPDLVRWSSSILDRLADLGSKKERTTVAPVSLRTRSYPLCHPHELLCTLAVSYPSNELADRMEEAIRRVLKGSPCQWDLGLETRRPAMASRKPNTQLAQKLVKVATAWEIPLAQESSLLPSVAGLVPPGVPVVCGLGPVAEDLNTPQEKINRLSLVQRTLLLAQFLLEEGSR